MLHQRYVLLSFVVVSVLCAITVQAGGTSIGEQFGFADYRVANVVDATSLVAVLSGFACFFLLLRNQRAISYVDEVVDEVMKVTWPTREETIRAASTVVFTTLFMSVLIGFYDFIWKALAERFLFTQG